MNRLLPEHESSAVHLARGSPEPAARVRLPNPDAAPRKEGAAVIVEIDLHLCYPSDKVREVDTKAVKALVASIEECGLLNPITVRKTVRYRTGQASDAYEVIVGMHRVKAFRYLQRATIPAIVLDIDDLHAELMLIDENLCRNDLSSAERAKAQARRKAIYLELHPETKHGAAGRGRAATGLGRTKLYEQIGAGRVQTRKFGARTLIVVDSLVALIDPGSANSSAPTIPSVEAPVKFVTANV
jgi:hypothetical protein